jgi:DNA-binding beta-propeller fold protein YncE
MSALVLVAAALVAQPLLEPAGEIPLPGVSGRIDHLAAADGRLYIAALGNASVEVVDLSARARVKSIAGLKEPQGIAADPGLQRVFVACAGDGMVHALDSRTFEEKGSVKLGDDADNVRLSGGMLYVGYGDGAVAALDPATLIKQGEVKVGGHPESFQAAGARVFINVPGGLIGGGGSVVVADREQRTVLATWPLKEAGRNFPMALDGDRLYVGCRRPARLLVLDTASGATVASMPTVGDADDVFADPARRRVYVSGGDGELDIYTRGEGDRYERSEMKTAPGARTSIFDSASSRLYVAAPARGDHPARLIEFVAKP